LFIPADLPRGTRLAEGWRPLDGEAGAPLLPNPHIVGAQGEKEVRILLEEGQSWTEIIEGMRGDLGDLPHERVDLGELGWGALYKIRGGHLVQWSREGIWYAVFGQGRTPEDVLRIARGMVPFH
jgi:hypothetical protein